MRSARQSASAAANSSRFHAASSDYAASNAFQMPAYTSHTSRHSPSKKQSSAKHHRQQQQPQQQNGHGPHSVEASQSYSESDQNLLAMLTSTVACLKEKRMDIEALGCLEQSLWLKRRMFGIESSAVHKALHEVVLSYNSIAMQFLAMGQFDQCLSMLRKAEAITAPPGNFTNCQSLQILTYNNIGCCYRKLGKLKSALKYLKEAAQVGAGCAHVKNLSITHLNLCAIQSQLGRHDLALEHAQAAIFHTQEELVSLDNGGDTGSEESNGSQGDVLDAKTREEKIVSLAVAYHNLAVELEFNGRGEASLQWYKKALQLVWKFKDSNQALCDSFEKIFQDAKKKYEAKQTQAPAASGAAAKKPAFGSRPKSAHPAASRSATANPQRDVSYSATVASQCYKPTKPSTAGLQYNQNGGSSPTSKASSWKQQQAQAPQQQPQWRPSSANPSNNASRRRPLSASSSARQSSANLSRQQDERIGGDDDGCGVVEARWKQIERELFGDKPPTVERAERPTGRPHSARSGLYGGNQERAHVKQPLRQTGPSLVSQDLVEDDDDCGIVQDDDDDGDDTETQFLAARAPPPKRETSATRPGPARPSTTQSVVRTRQASRSARDLRQSTSARHRQAVHETRHSDSSPPRGRPTETTRRRDQRYDGGGDVEATYSSGYAAGTDEDASNLSESSASSDLPQHRVSHLEYLRRMKRLAESIQDDLTGVPQPPPANSGKEDRRSHAAKPVATGCKQRGSTPRAAAASKGATATVADVDETPLSTPRSSSSKLRERLEFVRRESVKSSISVEDVEENASKPAASTAMIVEEDVFVFANVNEVMTAEQKLIEAASARQIQSAMRGNVAQCRVGRMREQKQQEEAARAIQVQAKLYLEHAKEREQLTRQQAEEARRLGDAAKVIQATYRRKFHGADNDQEDTTEASDEASQRGEPDQSEDEDESYTPRPTARSSSTPAPSDVAPNSSRQSTSRSSPTDSTSDDANLLTLPLSLPPSASSSAKSSARSQANSSRLATPRAQFQSALDDVRSIAALCIQRAYRVFRASSIVATKRLARRLSRSYVERQHLNLILAASEAREQAFLEDMSAIKIQALVRGRQARFLVEATRIGHHAAAASIQNNFRRHRQHVKSASARGVRSLAARYIQQIFRAYASRQAHQQQVEMHEEALEVHHIAAQTIQHTWRQWRVERDHRVEAWEAATCIQALGRGHLARKSCQSLKESASRSSAFSIDGDAPRVNASRDQIHEEPELAYEDLFEEDDVQVRSARKDAGGKNLSFLPARIRELYARFASTGAPVVVNRTKMTTEDMLSMGYGLDEMLEELQAACSDAESACLLLDAMHTLVTTHTERFISLPQLLKVTRVLDERMDECNWWGDPVVEQRVAAFMLLYQELLVD